MGLLHTLEAFFLSHKKKWQTVVGVARIIYKSQITQQIRAALAKSINEQ